MKKIVSIVLILATLFSVFATSAHAEETEKILVTELSALVNEPIDGEKMSFEVIAGEPEKYDVRISYWEDRTTNQKWAEEHGKEFVGGHSYTPHVVFVPKEGYYFSYRYAEMSGTINGLNAVKEHLISSDYCALYLMDYAFYCEVIPDERIPIKEINITIEGDIRGLTVKDYKQFIKIETEHITFDTSKYENEILISSQDYPNQCHEPTYDPYARECTSALKGGKYYAITFYIQPEEGYKIDENAIIKINGSQALPQNLFNGDSVLLGAQIQVFSAMQSFILKIMTAIADFFNMIAEMLNA